MRTYRLQFSSDPTILKRRFAKARISGADRILCQGFEDPSLYRHEFTGLWATETDSANTVSSAWDECHRLISQPIQSTKELLLTENDILVLQPRTLKLQSWIPWLSQFNADELQKKVFLEISPWNELLPQNPTVHEVSHFLEALKFHFPNWSPKRRPGVEMWDPRISSDLELEAGDCEQEIFNWNEDAPTVSVIIPTYNNKYFVRQVLQHLANQSFPKDQFEVILVDDSSNDGTLNYLNTFGIPTDLQLKYLYWKRPSTRQLGDHFFRAGLSRNLGVRNARGSQLVFLDSDILTSRNFLKIVSENLKTADVLQFPRHHIQQEKSKSVVHYEQITSEDLYLEEPNYWGPFYKTNNWMGLEKFWKYTCTYALAVKKDDFLAAGRFARFYVSYGFEDTELGYKLAQMGKQFRLVHNEPVLHLTSYSKSEYQLSQIKRRKLLQRTAKQFFLSTMDLEVYYHFRSFMTGDSALWPRIKSYFGSTNKTKSHGANALIFSASYEPAAKELTSNQN